MISVGLFLFLWTISSARPNSQLTTDIKRYLRVLSCSIHGGEACMWGEGKNASNIHLVAWPGALSLAERLWSAREVNDVDAATPRVMAMMSRLRERGVPVRPPANPLEDW